MHWTCTVVCVRVPLLFRDNKDEADARSSAVPFTRFVSTPRSLLTVWTQNVAVVLMTTRHMPKWGHFIKVSCRRNRKCPAKITDLSAKPRKWAGNCMGGGRASSSRSLLSRLDLVSVSPPPRWPAHSLRDPHSPFTSSLFRTARLRPHTAPHAHRPKCWTKRKRGACTVA